MLSLGIDSSTFLFDANTQDAHRTTCSAPPGASFWSLRFMTQRTLPSHVAMIMDGNGRWAERRGWPRVAGHRAGHFGAHAVRLFQRQLGPPARRGRRALPAIHPLPPDRTEAVGGPGDQALGHREARLDPGDTA